MIIRKFFLDQLLKFKDTEFVKVLTGIRRSGKSYLLQMYRDKLLAEGVDEKQIIFINFENYDYLDLQDDRELYRFVKSKVIKNKKMYLLFDEIQLVKDWQKVVNSFRVSFDSELVITGSNAQMLSGELATFLSGRYVEIHVYPLSFSEFLLFKDTDKSNVRKLPMLYQEYVRYGAFPMVVLAQEALKESILSSVFDTILLNDVAYRSAIKEPQVLRWLSQFLSSNVGQLVNPTKIANTLNSSTMKTTVPTIHRYLEMFKNAYLFYPSSRYDLRGKQYLKNQAKYYMADMGLRSIALGNKQDNFGSQLENIVYLELLRRGFFVDVGYFSTDETEVNFIARKGKEILYVQVAYQLPEKSTRETDNLLKIRDNYRKIVITERFEETPEIDGIPIINVIDWLLENEE